MKDILTLADVEALDRHDPLAHKRNEFLLPDNLIYLDGNSLGAMTLVAQQRARQVVEQEWGQDLIKSWNQHNWIHLPASTGEKIAQLIGAAAALFTGSYAPLAEIRSRQDSNSQDSNA